ncbi:RNA polymerase sigma factor [Streptomyces sp. SID3343]|uniref:RNA polymerase sigma factor n=1 Tax=Streptomyces sp. SID3343 TaxID=2690260 RepID=UPI0013715C89|nr:RNA polymerase sigma factor [Streptomyces sp. SID3343]MYW01162.1 sigma-70 family RNA polymerase sigma factor [Streptomyces sp. SID3343]MYW04158.1 sigma-70 family RNA polymerase sigma factor [Streptomyces sp. SID3343]
MRVDGESVQSLVAARGWALKRYAFVLCGDDDRADDLVQEALVRTLAGRPPTDPAELEAYVRRVMTNVVIDEFRRARRWARLRPAFLTRYAPSDQEGPETQVCARLWTGESLAQLPAGQRTCLVLYYLEDLPIAEIANVLGCTQGSVKSQLHDARGALRRTWANDGTTNSEEEKREFERR